MKTIHSTRKAAISFRRHASVRMRGSRRCGLITLSVVALCGFVGCGGDSNAPTLEAAAEVASDEPNPEESPRVGVDLGSFRIQETRPLENQRIDVTFSVQAAVTDANREELEELVAARRNAIRDQIITAVRTAETPEFDESELTFLRRRMMLRLRNVLAEPLVDDLFVTDYRLQVE